MDTRPWWKKKRNLGILLVGIGNALKLTPLAVLAPFVETAGGTLLGVGVVEKVDSHLATKEANKQ